MLRAIVVLALLGCAFAGTVAHADTVALLPLDADKRLELYGQPVAAELGRALKASGVDVVVVGAKMAVPERAQLIVDGSIKAGKGESITLTMRIRDRRDGTTLETVPASAATLTTIDRAASELSAKLVPAVKAHLAALAKPAVVERPSGDTRPPVVTPVGPPVPPAPTLPIVLVAAMSVQTGNPVLELVAAETSRELASWAHTHRHEASLVDAASLATSSATTNVVAARAELGIALEILGVSVEPGAVPLARARVRLRIADTRQVVFERVIRTDTIVGDRNIADRELAARVAREVLAIANAQLRRQVAGWR
jgi:hypothetical protein